jgi:hypothetical protein
LFNAQKPYFRPCCSRNRARNIASLSIAEPAAKRAATRLAESRPRAAQGYCPGDARSSTPSK